MAHIRSCSEAAMGEPTAQAALPWRPNRCAMLCLASILLLRPPGQFYQQLPLTLEPRGRATPDFHHSCCSSCMLFVAAMGSLRVTHHRIPHQLTHAQLASLLVFLLEAKPATMVPPVSMCKAELSQIMSRQSTSARPTRISSAAVAASSRGYLSMSRLQPRGQHSHMARAQSWQQAMLIV